ncbi:hypothetical protein IWX81_002130 [Salinibacterium sp. CAN_S4]
MEQGQARARWKQPVIIAALVIGVAVAAFTLGSVWQTPRASTGSYPVNSLGLTYGAIDDVPRPDLIAVTTDDGVDGYAFALQLLGRPPTTAAPTRSPGPRSVSVYDLSTETVLGVITVR